MLSIVESGESMAQNNFEEFLFNNYGLTPLALARLFLALDPQVKEAKPSERHLVAELERRYKASSLNVQAIEKLVSRRNDAWSRSTSLKSDVAGSQASLPKAERVKQAFALFEEEPGQFEFLYSYLQANEANIAAATGVSLRVGVRNLVCQNPLLAGKLFAYLTSQPDFSLTTLIDKKRERDAAREWDEQKKALQKAQMAKSLERKRARERAARRWDKLRRQLLKLEIDPSRFKTLQVEEDLLDKFSTRYRKLDDLAFIEKSTERFLPKGIKLVALHRLFEEDVYLYEDAGRLYVSILREMIEVDSGVFLSIYRALNYRFMTRVSHISHPSERCKYLLQVLYPRLSSSSLWVIIKRGDWGAIVDQPNLQEPDFEARWLFLENLSSDPWEWCLKLEALAEELSMKELRLYAQAAGDRWDPAERW